MSLHSFRPCSVWICFILFLLFHLRAASDEVLARYRIPAGNIPFSNLQGASLESMPGYLVIGDLYGRGTRVWDIARREVVNAYPQNNALGGSIHGHAVGDGRHVELYTVQSSQAKRLLVTDLASGQQHFFDTAIPGYQRALLGASKNRVAAWGSLDFSGDVGQILIYDVRNGTLEKTIETRDLHRGTSGFPSLVTGIVSGDSIYALTWNINMNPDTPAAKATLHRIDIVTGRVLFQTPVDLSRNENNRPDGRGHTYNLAAGDGFIAVAGRDTVTLVSQSTGEVHGVVGGLGRTVRNQSDGTLFSRHVGGLALGGGRMFVQAPVPTSPENAPGIRVYDYQGNLKTTIPNPYAADGDARPNDFGGSLCYQDGRLFAGQRVWVEGDSIENGDVWEYQLRIPDDGGAVNGTLVFFAETSATVAENESLNVEVRLTEPRATPVQINIASFETGSSDSATSGADFDPVEITLEFLPGQISRSFQVNLIDDTLVEPEESFRLAITNAVGVELGDAPIEMRITIVSDDYDHTADLIPLATLDANTRIQAPVDLPQMNADHILLPYPEAGRILLYDARNFAFRANLLSPAGSAGKFGSASALQGDFAVVSARTENANRGRVYLVNMATMSVVQTLENPDPTRLFFFGDSVAIEGGLLAITAHTDAVTTRREILIYQHDGTGWSYARTITSPFPTMNWARHIALSGGELIVPRESGQPGSNPPPATFFEALVQIYNPATGGLLRTVDPVPFDTGNKHFDAKQGRYAVSDTDGVKIRRQSDSAVLFETTEFQPHVPTVRFNGNLALWSFAATPVIFYHDLELDKTRSLRFLPTTSPALPSEVMVVPYGRRYSSFAASRSGSYAIATLSLPEFPGAFEIAANADHALVVDGVSPGALPTLFQLPRRAGVGVEETQVIENAGHAVVNLRLSETATHDVRVRWSTRDDTAIAGTDYTAASGWAVIPAGETLATVSIPVLDNLVVNEDRSFLVQILSVEGASIQDGISAVHIIDDETELNLPILTITGSRPYGCDAGRARPFTGRFW